MIGPFPPLTPRLFLGEPSIDFARSSTGFGGRPVNWTLRDGEPASGRVDLDDLGHAEGIADGGSRGLGAFGYAEVNVERAGPALLMVGSSGALMVTVNEAKVYQSGAAAGRPFAADSEVVRCNLVKGLNRILVFSRQGTGKWSYSIQIALLAPGKTDNKAAIATSRKE